MLIDSENPSICFSQMPRRRRGTAASSENVDEATSTLFELAKAGKVPSSWASTLTLTSG